MRRVALSVLAMSVLLLVASCGSASTGSTPGDEDGAAGVGRHGVAVDVSAHAANHATAEDLIQHSYVVAKGRFVGEPEIYATQKEDSISWANLVWRFEPTEVYRDVRHPASPSSIVEQARGTILVAASVNVLGEMTVGDVSPTQLAPSLVSAGNANSVRTDVEVYVFLRPGSAGLEHAAANRDLAHVMVMTDVGSCFPVEEMSRSCAYVAARPNGDQIGYLDPTSAPSDLTETAIRGAGSVSGVYSSPVEGFDLRPQVQDLGPHPGVD